MWKLKSALSSPPPPPPLKELVVGRSKTTLFIIIIIVVVVVIIIITVITINANNSRFTVLCSGYFSACDWRLLWCQYVADVK